MTRDRRRPPGRKGKRRARRESSAGGVVCRVCDGQLMFLLICDSYGNWGFPKGHLERGERADTAAVREVREETGIHAVTVLGDIATIDWFFQLRGELIHKNCQYFLMETNAADTQPQKSEGISACRWATADEALELISYKNARDVLQRAHEMIAARHAPATARTG